MIHPIRLVWKKKENLREVSIKAIIVVSKKYLKLASERNIVSRRIKEAYRLNKIEIETLLTYKKKQLNIAIIYKNEKILPYKVIEEKIKLILDRLREEI